MKKILFVLLIIFLFPMIVSAKEYDFYNDIFDEGFYPADTYTILHKGDVLNFSSIPNNKDLFLYIDDHLISGSCYGNGGYCLHAYTVTNEKIIINFVHYNNDLNYVASFVSVSDEIISYSDLKQNHLYQSGLTIFYPEPDRESFYYSDGNYLLDSNIRRRAEVIPKYQGMDVMWKVDIFDDSSYGFKCPHFKVYSYIKPEFKMTCKDKSIGYGKKTQCSIIATGKEELTEVSFNLKVPSFKVSNVTYPSYVSPFKGSKQYNLRINDNSNLNTGMELMSFYLQGTRNANYTDDIKISNIFYRDAVYDGNYDEIKGDLNIVPSKMSNPKTFGSLVFIILPIIALAMALFIVKVKERKQNA